MLPTRRRRLFTMKKIFRQGGIIGSIGVRAALFITIIGCAFLTGETAAVSGENGADGVDLRTSGRLEINPPFPDPGDEVEVGIWVENRGTVDADDVSVYFYADGLSFDREVTDVRKGDSVFIRTMWTAESGETFLSVVIDPGKEYHDDRHDNEAKTWVIVR
jgi:hypothetical protein